MELDSKDRQEEIALFRFGLISDLVHLPTTGPDADGATLHARLREKEAQTYRIPNSNRTRVAAETMRDWLYAYREGGFDALKPKRRKDTGAARRIPTEIADLLVMLKDEHPDWSIKMVIDAAKEADEAARKLELPTATVHRLLTCAGVMKKRADAATSKDRRHFSYQRAGELWMSDVMHGPSVRVGQRKLKAYLHAFLDDATRVVPYAAFALQENTAAYLPVFRQAIQRRGLPERLYVDNGAVYRGRHLALVCAKLGVTLIHARPFQPQGKGKQERFFRTVRMQLLPLLGEAELSSLEALNRRLWAWIEGEYHQRPHKGLDGISPLDAWAMKSSEVRVPGPEVDLREMFLYEQKRKVQRDRTVSLKGVLYEIDAALVGETVTLRYDPTKAQGPVDVWHEGKRVQVARVVDAYANCFVKRHHSTKKLEADGTGPATPGPSLALRELAERRRREGEREEA